MEDNDRDRTHPAHHLILSRENFDDYLVALTAKLRSNVDVDRVLSGETPHPLLDFQIINSVVLTALNVVPQALFSDPVTSYVNFIRQLTDALLRVPVPVPNINGLIELQASQTNFHRAETSIYTTIVDTLRVGKSMYYARQVRFGAGQQLLRNIVNDNRQITTRSLMAIFRLCSHSAWVRTSPLSSLTEG